MLLSQQQLQQLSEIFQVLGHVTKVRVLRYVIEQDPEPVVPTLTHIALDIPPNQAAYSLKQMSKVGILTRNVSGRYTFYEVDPQFRTLLEEFLS